MSTSSSSFVKGATTMSIGLAIAATSFLYGEVRLGGIGLGIVIIGVAQMTGHA